MVGPLDTQVQNDRELTALLEVSDTLAQESSGGALVFQSNAYNGGRRLGLALRDVRASGGGLLVLGRYVNANGQGLASLDIRGTTRISDGGTISVYTAPGVTARFGAVEFGAEGNNRFYMNDSTVAGTGQQDGKVVEVAGLSGGSPSTRVAIQADNGTRGAGTVLRLTGGGTYTYDGRIFNNAGGGATSLTHVEITGGGTHVLTRQNDWGGGTSINDGALVINGSHIGRGGDYEIGAWGRLGGGGTIGVAPGITGGNPTMTFQPGAAVVFDPRATLTVNKDNTDGFTVDLANMTPQDLVLADGSTVPWGDVPVGSYALMDGTATFVGINTDWVYDIGSSGKDARFRAGGGLGLEVVAGSGNPATPPRAARQRPAETPSTGAAVATSQGEQPVMSSDPVNVEVSTGPAEVRDAVDWPGFIGAHDLVWTATPKQWNEGGFTGNGQLGIMAYAMLDDNRFDFHLGRSDVTDHRGAPDEKSSMGVADRRVMFDYPRLDIGRMAFRPAGTIQSVTMHQDLWNAELRGTIHTDLGVVHFRVVTLRDEMVHAIDITSEEKGPGGQAAAWRWEYLPGNPDSPRFQVVGRERAPDYERNPLPTLEVVDGVRVVEQRLLAGGDYATAWGEIPLGGGRSRLLVSTANEDPPAGRSAPAAVETLRRVGAMDFETALAAHRAWWHDFYQRSFLSIPEPKLESFYWIQLYKFASAAREGGPAVDLLGPWFRVTIWPGIWWNLNVQLTYWLPGMANHLELSHTLVDTMNRYWDGLLARHGRGSHRGDFAWALHNYWLHYRLAGDWQALAEQWQPKAVQMLENYRDVIEEGPDGRLHLKPMGSPEFKGFDPFKNTNYNLALIRWLALSLQAVNERTGVGAREAAEWGAIAARLVDPPVDENGLMIGSDQPFDETHRHFSHLIGFYPLYIFDADNPAIHAALTKSIHHWLSLRDAQGRQDRTGYSQAAAASMHASIGEGNEAARLLVDLLDNRLGNTRYGSRILANTFYTEVHGLYPTIETPFAAASATIELLLQSWGGKVRVFPAAPDAWPDATFHRLRAEGGFLVSAQRKSGRTAWIAIESTMGESLVLKVPDWDEGIVAQSERPADVRSLGGGEFAIDLRRGERILLSPASAPVDQAVVAAIPRREDARNPFGVRPENQLEENQSSPHDIPLRLPGQ